MTNLTCQEKLANSSPKMTAKAIDKNKIFGYIDKNSNDVENQKKALKTFGIDDERIILEENKFQDYDYEFKTPKDIVYVAQSMETFSSSGYRFLRLQSQLFDKKIKLVCLELTDGLDQYASVDKLDTRFVDAMIIILKNFFKVEQRMRKKKQNIGIQKAKQEQKYRGRKSIIGPELISRVKSLKKDAKTPTTKIAKITNTSRGTIYKILSIINHDVVSLEQEIIGDQKPIDEGFGLIKSSEDNESNTNKNRKTQK